MKTKQKSIELKKLIAISRILIVINQLKQELASIQGIRINQQSNYLIYRDVLEIMKTISLLESQLKDLIHQSTKQGTIEME